MNTFQRSLTILKKYFKKHKVADISELKKLLNTSSRMSIFRRLKMLEYCSSFSHAGKYYTLKDIPNFNNFKIWHYNDIGFSLHGNLKETVLSLIIYSEAGHTHRELENVIKVRVHNTLLNLVKEKKINREKFKVSYLYLSHENSKAKAQRANRIQQDQGIRESSLPPWIVIEVLVHIIRTNQIVIDSVVISEQLAKKGLVLTKDQIEQTIKRFNIKKKLDKAHQPTPPAD
ncbi:MAG: hypothetical protein GY714_00670 [Desulfobacterales bacterium]|nr:hypothetical protein [Desulfobacterales bacterium]